MNIYSFHKFTQQSAKGNVPKFQMHVCSVFEYDTHCVQVKLVKPNGKVNLHTNIGTTLCLTVRVLIK